MFTSLIYLFIYICDVVDVVTDALKVQHFISTYCCVQYYELKSASAH